MKVPLLDLKAQYAVVREKVRAAVDEVLESQHFILGCHVSRLEEEIARLCDLPYAVGVASGTDALLLALKALGVGPGDSVVTVPDSFYATASTIVNLGARPLFVDIDEPSYNMDPEQLALLLERDCSFEPLSGTLVHRSSETRVKAIVPVHLFGQCAEMAEIAQIADHYRLPIVEDACQAIGARYGEKAAGALGTLGCFSFFPSKNLGGAGDGGMVVTRDSDLACRIRLLRVHGAQLKYYHSMIGFNSRLDELQAAILRAKLPYLDDWTAMRRRNACFYQAELRSAGLDQKVVPPTVLPGRTHVFHHFVIRCRQRDELREFLESRGIGTATYYPVPLHQQECFRYLRYAPEDFPRSCAAARETLALPVHPQLTPEQKAFVVTSIAEFYAAKQYHEDTKTRRNTR
jgi:dTDP-4-amino-4,6-dideoxygalactose transaminase